MTAPVKQGTGGPAARKSKGSAGSEDVPLICRSEEMLWLKATWIRWRVARALLGVSTLRCGGAEKERLQIWCAGGGTVDGRRSKESGGEEALPAESDNRSEWRSCRRVDLRWGKRWRRRCLVVAVRQICVLGRLEVGEEGGGHAGCWWRKDGRPRTVAWRSWLCCCYFILLFDWKWKPCGGFGDARKFGLCDGYTTCEGEGGDRLYAVEIGEGRVGFAGGSGAEKN